MTEYTSAQIRLALIKVGLRKGQTIFICPEIYKFGILKDIKNRSNYFKIFLKIITGIIGKNGTIVINTYTFNTLRYKETFYFNAVSTTSGKMGDYLLGMKDSVRSNHPVFSVSSLGKLKKDICQNNSLNNYGSGSPYKNFMKFNGKILNLGQDFWLNPFLHVAEFDAGIPYYYNKFTNVVYKNKNIKNKKFSSFVQYKHLNINYDFNKIKKLLLKNKFIKKATLGSGMIFLYDVMDFYNTLSEQLKNDHYYLLKSPPNYTKSKTPFI
jgi:aminoglycoside 3-N-acetyltransferase|tara:strand:- start:31 stop:831 length:801 start_codon:yes stop_codon:yes gene_type:complete